MIVMKLKYVCLKIPDPDTDTVFLTPVETLKVFLVGRRVLNPRCQTNLDTLDKAIGKRLRISSAWERKLRTASSYSNLLGARRYIPRAVNPVVDNGDIRPIDRRSITNA